MNNNNLKEEYLIVSLIFLKSMIIYSENMNLNGSFTRFGC